MKILVTGGAGFIGSHIAEYLVQRGDDVTVLDNLHTGRKENLVKINDKITFVNGDIRDYNLLEKLVLLIKSQIFVKQFQIQTLMI